MTPNTPAVPDIPGAGDVEPIDLERPAEILVPFDLEAHLTTGGDALSATLEMRATLARLEGAEHVSGGRYARANPSSSKDTDDARTADVAGEVPAAPVRPIP